MIPAVSGIFKRLYLLKNGGRKIGKVIVINTGVKGACYVETITGIKNVPIGWCGVGKDGDRSACIRKGTGIKHSRAVVPVKGGCTSGYVLQ